MIRFTLLTGEANPLWETTELLHHVAAHRFHPVALGPASRAASWGYPAHHYKVSPGTLYPMLARLTRLGWLKAQKEKPTRGGQSVVRYRLTPAGRTVLAEVQARLRELQREVFAPH